MTVTELYEWAKREGIEDYRITVVDDSVHGTCDAVIDRDDIDREILMSEE